MIEDYQLWASQFPRLQKATRKLWAVIKQEFDEQQPPMTVRQMFYRMSSGGHVAKTEAGYRKVQYNLTNMRRKGAIPYAYLADSTRWVRQPRGYESLADALFEMQLHYRRRLWANQDVYVEIWLEKDALAGVIYDITAKYDVPLYVTRGYPSLSYLHEAAESLKAIDKPIYIYHFGDYDASGQDAARSIHEGLRGFGAEFKFIQAAVTPKQILSLNLPTRPAKKSDPRSKKHGSLAVELDAIPPATLRTMVNDVIEQHIDYSALEMTQLIEQQERDTIKNWMNAA